jgi:hypothetical protein
MLKEHDVVTITVDQPEQGLSAGDVGAVVHCYTGQDAYEVEFVNDQGRSKGVVTLPGTCLLRLNLSSLLVAQVFGRPGRHRPPTSQASLISSEFSRPSLFMPIEISLT